MSCSYFDAIQSWGIIYGLAAEIVTAMTEGSSCAME